MGLIKNVSPHGSQLEKPDPCFKPFVSDGFVSLTGDPTDQYPVKILRHGGSQSIIRGGILSLSVKLSCNSNAVVHQV